MKTKIKIVLLLILIMTSCSYEEAVLIPKITDLQNLGLTGKVKSFTEITIPITTETDDQSKSAIITYLGNTVERKKFNELGYLVEENNYNLNQELLHSTVYLYDSTNEKLNRKISYQSTNWKYKYNEYGKIIEKRMNKGRLKRKWNYQYENGKKTNIRKISNKEILKDGIEKAYEEIEAVNDLLDEKRDRIDEFRYFKDKCKGCNFIFKLNFKSDTIEKKRINEFGFLDCSVTYNYDDEGNRIEANYLCMDKENIYQYDEKERKGQRIEYDTDGYIESLSSLEFDNSGNLVRESEFDSDNKLKAKHEYQYDFKWKKVSGEKTTEPDGSRFEIKYIFNENGVVVEEKSSSLLFDNASKSKTLFKYDELGRKCEELMYDEDSLVSINKFKYSDKGLLIEENIVYPISGITKQTTYEYDNYDNWIKKITKSDSSFLGNYFEKREIEYYE